MAPTKKPAPSTPTTTGRNATVVETVVKTEKMPSTPSATPSPKRKPGGRPTADDTRKKGKSSTTINVPTLTCYGFASELPIEGYIYSINDSTDAFANGFKKFVNGELESAELTSANFSAFHKRRVPRTENTVMLDGKRFFRYILFRYVPGGVSTPETRFEGLAVLKTFFLSTQNGNFPPTNINVVDGTDVNNPPALDMFFCDKEIRSIMEEEFLPEELNKDFYSRYTAFACKLWSGEPYPDFARMLGFPWTSQSYCVYKLMLQNDVAVFYLITMSGVLF